MLCWTWSACALYSPAVPKWTPLFCLKMLYCSSMHLHTNEGQGTEAQETEKVLCQLKQAAGDCSLKRHLGGVASGGGASLLEHRLEGGQGLRSHARADAIVLTHHNVLLIALHMAIS